MKITISQLRALIREHMSVRKMPYDEVSPLLDDLVQQLEKGNMSEFEFDREYDAVLRAAGWSPREFEQEIDRRWDIISNLQAPAAPRRSYTN